MPTFRITRHVTTVQYAFVEADTSEDALQVATDDPHRVDWWDSSHGRHRYTVVTDTREED